MKLKFLEDYDICNYKTAAMFIGAPTCSFKCDKECGQNVCQNSALAKEPIVEIELKGILKRYRDNPLTHAVVIGGLEPFDSEKELFTFIMHFTHYFKDPIIIYTGYTEEELTFHKESLHYYSLDCPIIVKYGRFIPNRPHKYSSILGVELASDNQYAVKYYAGKEERDEHSIGNS